MSSIQSFFAKSWKTATRIRFSHVFSFYGVNTFFPTFYQFAGELWLFKNFKKYFKICRIFTPYAPVGLCRRVWICSKSWKKNKKSRIVFVHIHDSLLNMNNIIRSATSFSKSSLFSRSNKLNTFLSFHDQMFFLLFKAVLPRKKRHLPHFSDI